MLMKKSIITWIFIYNLSLQVSASTHFIVKEGMIEPQVKIQSINVYITIFNLLTTIFTISIKTQIDSPYHLRRPHDLVAFLDQSNYKTKIDSLFEELMSIKNDLMSKMNHLDRYKSEFMGQYQEKCSLNYYLKIEDLYSTITTKKYIKRIENLKNELMTRDVSSSESGGVDVPTSNSKLIVPNCDNYLTLNYSMYTFDHLSGVSQRNNYSMEPESELSALKELGGISNTFYGRRLAESLKKHPKSWKLYTLSSYYWRYKGDARRAVDCARRAVYLAPRKNKDIALLSLGTIFQRTNNNLDAIVVLKAAVDHNIEYAENHYALGNSLFMLSDFDRALRCYEAALLIDKIFSEKIDCIKKSVKCFKYAKKRLINMEKILDEMLVELERFAERKNLLEECHDKLIKEQVPLGSRFNDSPHDSDNHQLLTQRSQYCSKRFDEDTTEPILFCDFFSDIQMRMNLKVVAIDLINNYVERTNDLIKRHLESSLGVFKYLDVDRIDGVENDIL